MDFHFAIDVVTDLAAIMLECSVSGSVNLQELDEYNTPSRRIQITATPEEHDAMNKALEDFAENPLSYDLHELMDDVEIQEMAQDVEAIRKELYETSGQNRNYHVKAEDVKQILLDWEGACHQSHHSGRLIAIGNSLMVIGTVVGVLPQVTRVRHTWMIRIMPAYIN